MSASNSRTGACLRSPALSPWPQALTPARFSCARRTNRSSVQQKLVGNLSSTITLAQASAGQHQSQLLAYQMQKDQALDDAAKAPPPHTGSGGLGYLGPAAAGEETAKGKGKKCVFRPVCQRCVPGLG